MKLKRTIIINVFPGCGNPWENEELKKKYQMEYSGIVRLEDTQGEIGKRNVQKFIKLIETRIGKFDFIFIQHSNDILDAMIESNLNPVLVYPSVEMKEQWLSECEDAMCNDFLSKIWESFIVQLLTEVGNRITTIPLTSEQLFIDETLLDSIYEDRENSINDTKNL